MLHEQPSVTIFLQTINFFQLGPKVCLVDLPGYGFAYAKEEVKEAWEELVSMPMGTGLFMFLFIYFSHLYAVKHHNCRATLLIHDIFVPV